MNFGKRQMAMIDIRPAGTMLLISLSLAACGGGTPEEERRPLGEVQQAPAAGPGAVSDGGEARASLLPPEAQMHLDSGNAAYRAKDFRGALAHYREAARMEPDQPATWFGVGMAANALGDKAMADSAKAQVERLSPAMQEGAHPAVPPAPDGTTAEGAPAPADGR